MPPHWAPVRPRRPQRCDTRPRRGVRSPDVRAMGRRGSPGPSAAFREPLDGATGVHRAPAPGRVCVVDRVVPGRDGCAPRLRRAQTISGVTQRLALPPTITPIFPKPPAPPLEGETGAPSASETQPEPRLPTVVPMQASLSADCDRAGFAAARTRAVFGDDRTPSRERSSPREPKRRWGCRRTGARALPAFDEVALFRPELLVPRQFCPA